MTIKDMANKYIETDTKIRELNIERIDLYKEGREKFGCCDWLEAIGECPIKEKEGKIIALCGSNVWDVVGCLVELANKRNTKLSCEFNGTDVIAIPGNSAEETYQDWGKRSSAQGNS